MEEIKVGDYVVHQNRLVIGKIIEINEEDIRWEREELVKKLQEQGHYVVDTIFTINDIIRM